MAWTDQHLTIFGTFVEEMKSPALVYKEDMFLDFSKGQSIILLKVVTDLSSFIVVCTM